jgi:hypothetical protein
VNLEPRKKSRESRRRHSEDSGTPGNHTYPAEPEYEDDQRNSDGFLHLRCVDIRNFVTAGPLEIRVAFHAQRARRHTGLRRPER